MQTNKYLNGHAPVGHCRKNMLLVILMGALSFNACHAQESDSGKVFNGISLSYIGNGLQLGVEKFYLKNEKYKIIGSAQVNFQRFPGYYSSAGLIFNSLLRRTYAAGIFLEHGLQFGYLGSYYDFDVYKTNSDGNIVNLGRTWANSVILGYFAGVGYDFLKRTGMDFQLFVKPGFYYRVPNNDNIFYLNNFSFEIGLILHPMDFK